MPSELTAVLFDLDGTLLDSEIFWDEAQQATMKYFGQEWTAQDQEFGLGGPVERVLDYMAEKTGADPEHILRVLVTEIETLVATRRAEWMPGAEELVEGVLASGLPVAIVSNSWRVIVDLLMDRRGIRAHAVVTSTEAANPKPAPDPYLMACANLGVEPATAVVVEDSTTGVAAGLAAGCAVLSVSSATAAVPAHPRLTHRDSLEGVTPAFLAGLLD